MSHSSYRPGGILFLAIFLVAAWCNILSAQDSPRYYDYPQHHLPWYTLESRHFLVHFQEGNSRSAQVASRIAEEIYPHITGLYGEEPDPKTSIVLKDREDYANGAAYFFDNMIEIWLPALDSPLRGTHNWLRDVITHEFVHIVQLNTAMKKNRTLPAVYFQWLSYEEVRRPDVLYGYPNGLITYPFSSISVPGWFAEGTAQYQRTGWTYDTWDSHRDMVLRIAMLNDSYLSFEQMGTFASKTSLEREQVYNQGFAFSAYLAGHYGESVFRKISETLGRPGVFNIDHAIERTTGKSGREQFGAWVSERKASYAEAVKSIRPDSSATVEPNGFLNLYPEYSPDGSKVAYLSNKNISESRVSLFIKPAEDPAGKMTELELGSSGVYADVHSYHCGFADTPLIDRIRSAFSFSPGGERIVFTRNRLTRYGESYNDLFVYHFETEAAEPLTRGSRIHDPAWSPEGNRVAAVQVSGGTGNLVLVDPSDGSVRTLTSFRDGEQVYTPAWHPDGDALYFSYGELHGRSIRKFDLKSGQTETVLEGRFIDFRDPLVDKEGLFLYYSADPDGIFNIYRIPVGGGKREKLTSVLGGAFMPDLRAGNELLYSEYRDGGYKIVSKRLSFTSADLYGGSYWIPHPSVPFGAQTDNGRMNGFPGFGDTDIDPLRSDLMAAADTGSVQLSVPTEDAPDERTLYSYRQEFTKFSFYPVIRFDNYTKLHGSNASLLKAGNFGLLGENLLRDMKVGTYITSREVIDRLSIFGGALFGIGSRDAAGLSDFFKPSRLTDLDRDLFLTTEYRGLPFIKRRWSPTLSVELYNLRRNVSDGLTVEEFPCTSCLPDTTSVDIAYNIWEADLYLRSKINNYSMIELGIGYTPYEVQTRAFFSRELEQTVPSSSTEYFRGTTLSAAYIYENFLTYPDADTSPLGLRTKLRYAYQPSELLENFEIEDGTLSPVYNTSRNHSVEFSSRYGFKLGSRSTGQLYSRFFSFFNRPDDFFYLDYIGGFTGMRSFPFFGIGGNTTAMAQFSYVFPVFTDISRQFGRHTLDKLFVRLFVEAGNGWKGPLEIGSNLKSGVGAELRFAFNSYYLYPLKFFISGAYGFNQFDVNLPSEFITGSDSNRVTYGREILLHFGLTFDFEILNHD